MENIIIFLSAYGWQIASIAVAGVILLGVLKYANAFAKIKKEKRKPVYFMITVGFSMLATAIYLLATNSFEMEYFLAVSGAIYALNQTVYAIYETTTLRNLACKIAEYLKTKLLK